MLDNNLKIGVVGIPGGWSSEKLADAVAARTGSRILINITRIDACLLTGKVRYEGVAKEAVQRMGRVVHGCCQFQ